MNETMECWACGYKYSIMLDIGSGDLKISEGEKPFAQFNIKARMVFKGKEGEKRKLSLFICPRCGTIKFDKNHFQKHDEVRKC